MNDDQRFDEYELPNDPDWDTVPATVRRLHEQRVTVTDADGEKTTGVVVVAPGLFGHADRLRRGFMRPGEQPPS